MRNGQSNDAAIKIKAKAFLEKRIKAKDRKSNFRLKPV